MTLVYGGSFNPPTLAHQAILDKLKDLYPEAKIIVIPVGDDYRKKDLAPFFHRVEMIKLMIEEDDNIIISSIEGHHPFHGTIETLNMLSQTYSDIHVVIGQDQLASIDSWIRAKELIENYPFLIMRRNNSMDQSEVNQKLNHLNYRFKWIDFYCDMSSTMYRINPQKQKHLISIKVNAYIEKHQLYKGELYV